MSAALLVEVPGWLRRCSTLVVAGTACPFGEWAAVPPGTVAVELRVEAGGAPWWHVAGTLRLDHEVRAGTAVRLRLASGTRDVRGSGGRT